ncbi:restriction endonuclease subunit S [Streptococcus pluranimalium]
MTYIDEMIKERCPNGVEWKELGEVVDYEQPTKYIVKSKEYSDDYSVPVLTAGQTFILGYTNEETGIYPASKEHSVIIFDDFTTARKWVDFEFKVKSSAMKILSIKSECQDEVSIRYVWHYLGTIKYAPEQHARQWIGIFSKFKIPLPPLEIQQEIVQILDKFTEYVTELTAELTAELTLRQKQYNYFRDYLLNFDNDSSGGANNKVYTVQWKTLGEVLVKGRGTKVTAGQMKELHKDGAPIRIFAGGKTFADVDYGDIPEKDIHHEEAVIVKSRGIIDFEYYTKPFSFKNEFWSYSSDNEDVNLRYVYHYLNHNKSYFQHIASNMQMPQISSNDTEKYKIPLPDKTVQSRIVQVLDNFDTVCNDLSIGLPKEIELRQKQYEFFRDKLLTFTAEGVYTDSTVQYRQDLIRLLTWVFGPIRVELGAVCDVVRGKRVVKSQLHLSEGYPVYQNSLTALGYFEHYNREAETAFLISAGAAGEVGYTRSRCWTADDVWTFDTEVIDQRYLYYLLLSKQETVKAQVRKASVPRLSKSAIENLVFILPLIDQQNRIVSILDRFDTLTTDLSQGLPAEIEQRQKQYEYLRDQLLQF